MKHPVIAIGLESAEPALLEKWMSQGHLKNLNSLCQQGTYGRLTNIEYHGTETEWTTFLTGCLPKTTGYWRPLKFSPETYGINTIEAYDFVEYQPFYALGDKYRVAAFDLPQAPLSPQVNGLQILAWGAHDPQTQSRSYPLQLLPELISKYGKHPAFKKCYGDNWWDTKYLRFLSKALKVGISRRAAICRDLLRREQWDLFVTIFGETHAAGHMFWHLNQPDHPLYRYGQEAGFLGNPMLETFQAIDLALGDILAEAPDDAYVVIFDALGMGSNNNELPSMLFLGEFLYRFNFPGKCALAPGKLGTTPPPQLTPGESKDWATAVWELKYELNWFRKFLRESVPSKYHSKLDKLIGKLDKLIGINQGVDLIAPYQLARRREQAWQQPVSWYKSFWSQMKAFALPSFSDGFIRINLQGREAKGRVALCDYDALCAKITQELYSLKDARTGKSIVKKVIKTRNSAFDRDPKLPDADLVVIWQDYPTDVVDSPNFGRIGPVPYHRSGGHQPNGCLIIKGPNIAPGSTLPDGHAVDIAPTILELMGAPIPEYFEGKSLTRQLLAAMV
ncbi:MAG: nucleotide pyrophosphatase [Symploca sp. SIO2E9]|nr:nucleotide pyrophosphatase [Symploca sp. SIO2E9]